MLLISVSYRISLSYTIALRFITKNIKPPHKDALTSLCKWYSI